MNIQQILLDSISIIKEVGKFIRAEQGKLQAENIETKNIHDYVTYVDKNAEKELVNRLRPLIPTAGFITEEKTTTTVGECYNWIIDPLDGTTNYIHGLFPVSVSVALQENNQTIMGIVYEIGMDECFYATKGSGAYLNGERITVTTTETVSGSLIATGFPYKNYSKISEFMESLEFFMKNSHGLRRLGSAATDLAYVAAGRLDAFYEYGLNPWDVAAGALIVEEAGGKICDFKGEDNYLNGEEIIASNSATYNELLSFIKQLIYKK